MLFYNTYWFVFLFSFVCFYHCATAFWQCANKRICYVMLCYVVNFGITIMSSSLFHWMLYHTTNVTSIASSLAVCALIAVSTLDLQILYILGLHRSPAPAPARIRHFFQIRQKSGSCQNSAGAGCYCRMLKMRTSNASSISRTKTLGGFGKSKSSTTLVHTCIFCCYCLNT